MPLVCAPVLASPGGFWYFLVPVYMYLKNLVVPKGMPL